LNDKKTGVSTFYNRQGKKINEVTYQDDKKHGKELNFFVNTYDQDGVLESEFFYVLGNKEGNFKVFCHNGNGKVEREGNYSKNMLNGIVKQYSVDGVLSIEGNYINDKKTGKFKYYWWNSQINQEIIYVNDKMHGPNIIYFSNGKIHRKATIDTNSLAVAYADPFKDEHVIGDYYKYNEDGTLSNHYFAYKDGRLDIKFPKPEPVVISSAKTAPNPQVSNANNGPKLECYYCHEISYKEDECTTCGGCTMQHEYYVFHHKWTRVQSQKVLGKCERCGVVTYLPPIASERCGHTAFIHVWEKY
jgi:antitoxin component YwqK of YwqJK toxin-antitoxin module